MLSPSFSTHNHKTNMPMLVLFIITIFLLPLVSGTNGNETDRVALLAIKSALKDPNGVLSSWDHSIDHCHWEGIICGHRHPRVVALNLSSRGLAGSISPYVGNLSFLHTVNLSINSIGGQIPAEIGFLSRLLQLRLYGNLLSGEIPSSVSNCSSLEKLSVGGNSLVGRVPLEFSSLIKLTFLSVDTNKLSGSIFSAIQNLTSLEKLSAGENAFEGTIPDTIGRMKSLARLALGSNQLTGTLPSSLYNLSSLTVLALYGNQFHGSLPKNIASALPHLQILLLSKNHFTGPFPVSLSNTSGLTKLDLGKNKFSGKLSWNFGNLKHLQLLQIGDNSLGSGDVDDLSFMYSLVNSTDLQLLGLCCNNFGGALPTVIANLSANLKILELHRNSLSGKIPVSIGRFSKLVQLKLQFNHFSGTVPREIGNLQQLELIVLHGNMFTGTIPESLGNLSKLSALSLQRNYFQGGIPSSLGNCQNLNYIYVGQNNLSGKIPSNLFKGSPHLVELDLSYNHLEGPLPSEVSQQKNLVFLSVSANNLSGEIPSVISICTGLFYLYMQGNMFHGRIPTSLASLTSLQELDLSHNNFSGAIPTFLSKFPLTYLNLSYNHFDGEVPTGGVFGNISAISLVGNPNLCGGILQLHLPRCPAKQVKRAKLSFKLKLVMSCVCALVGVAIVVSLYCIYRGRKRRQPSLPVSSFGEPFFKVTYKMLLKATEGFSSSNFLGAGTFGSVFKGVLEHDQMTVAVKVLNLQQPGAARSFVAECEALRNVRHKNLVSVITACSSIDYQGNDFKALVYEYMRGGSLESWLHANEGNDVGEVEVRNLSLVQRVNIALDVASALEYLHCDCEVPIVHRDLKPSNVLLDNDMVAHVGDFGMARFLPQPLHPNQSTSTGVIKGTIGYVAPEYGLGGDPSVASDIYSFGILLLEMMTGKRPTDEMFEEGLNLHTYVRMALPDQVLQIVDTRLLDSEGHVLNNVRTQRQAATWMNCVVTMMKIGVACSMESPQDRINLKDASVELLKVKKDLIRDGLTHA